MNRFVEHFKTNITNYVALLAFSLTPINSYSLSGGVTGYSSNPATNNGNNCTACHTGGVAPSVSLAGPLTVEAGSINTFTLSVSGGQQNIAGLNISSTSGSLGSLTPGIVLDGGELRHSQSINTGATPTEWTFQIQAPVVPGSITMYAAVLSANGDGQMSGDNATSKSLTIAVTAAQKKLVPIANFTAPAFATPNQIITFDADASTDGDGSIVRYLWDFGDGSTFEQGSPATHTFSSENTYTVTLAVTDNDGLTGAVAHTVTISTDNNNAQGEALYNQYCFACHGAGGNGGSTSPITGVSASQVNNALSAITAMQSLNLSTEEIQFIVEFLNSSSGGEPPPRPTNGPGIYAMFCSACHGADGRGGSEIGVTGASFAMISAAISEVTSMQSLDLNNTEIQLVAEFLASGGNGAIPDTGVGLYTVFCSVCHGSGGHGGKFFAVTGASQQMISEAITNIEWMQALSLSDQQLQQIGDYLGAGGEPPLPLNNKGLYDTFCHVCHGAGGHGGKFKAITGASNEMIADAITSETWMRSLQLTNTQQLQIAEYLGSGGEPPIPTDGAGLYAVFCAVCHGEGGRGGKFKAITGAPSSMINNAISNEPWMDSLSLTSTQINLIASFLTSGGSGTTPVTGADIYSVFCSVCHGLDGRGGTYKVVTGSSTSFINRAMNNVNLMSALSLNATQLQSVAEYLAAGGGGSKPNTGTGLYRVYCETCHGPNGNGGPEENVRGASTSEINSAITGESAMRHLQPYLTQSGSNSDTSLISNFLRQ